MLITIAAIITTVIYFIWKVIFTVVQSIRLNTIRKLGFILKYEVVKLVIIQKFMDTGIKGKVLYNKIYDADTLSDIVFKNIDKEENEIDKNSKKFYKRLYKEYKKEDYDFERFINKKFIGISNFLRCYGMTEWNIIEDVKSSDIYQDLNSKLAEKLAG